jgi:RNA polymerase sigma-70 factor (ECF subfamily)
MIEASKKGKGITGVQKTDILSLYDQYSETIYRIAYSYLHHSQDAQDAVQVVFLKLLEGKAEPISGKERAFLTQITINYCINSTRVDYYFHM